VRQIEFEDSDYYTGPVLTDPMVTAAEELLGHRLPSSYVDLLRVRNGGIPTLTCFRTDFETAWAPTYFEISGILGIGHRGIEESPYMINEWGYPDIGIVICDTPAAGPDTVMLDYRAGLTEPQVAYVDEDGVPHVVAKTFADFLKRLESAESF
jgi:hypothetical protein